MGRVILNCTRLKAALKAKSLNFSGEEYKDGFISYKVENEGAGMMDIMYAKYLVSDLPDPSQKDLDAISSKATKIDVVTYVKSKKVKGMGHEMEEKTFKQLSQNQIKELFQCIKIKEDDITHVMNIGEISFKIFQGDNLFGTIRYVSNGYIRWDDKWKDDALLVNPTKFLEWLASIGIDEPLKEAIKSAKKAEENNVELQKWASVAPKTLINQIDPNTISQAIYFPTTGVPQETNGQIEQDPYSLELFALLKAEIPNETELILTLFKVFGNDFGAWSGFPAYELLPENVLMLISIEKLNQVIDNQDLTAEHKEGIARFLSGWHFMQKRQSDISQVSQKTKEMLLKHLKAKGDKEKIKLFKQRVMN